jgi:broad specificity phosphatase PhoE
MSTVKIIRHGKKDGTKLSQQGRLESFVKGQALKNQYKSFITYGSDFQASEGYPGRAVETADLLVIGAGLYGYARQFVDSKLVPKYSDAEYKQVIEGIKSGMTPFESAYKFARESLYANAKSLADFVEQYEQSVEGEAVVGVTHSPSIEALAYLLGVKFDEAKPEPKELDGITVAYDSKSGIYTATVDYASGQQINVQGSLSDAVESSAETIDSKVANAETHNAEAQEAEASEATGSVTETGSQTAEASE